MAGYPEQVGVFIVRAAVDRTNRRARFRITSSTDVEGRRPETRVIREEEIVAELHAWIGSIRIGSSLPDRIDPR